MIDCVPPTDNSDWLGHLTGKVIWKEWIEWIDDCVNVTQYWVSTALTNYWVNFKHYLLLWSSVGVIYTSPPGSLDQKAAPMGNFLQFSTHGCWRALTLPCTGNKWTQSWTQTLVTHLELCRSHYNNIRQADLELRRRRALDKHSCISCFHLCSNGSIRRIKRGNER